MLKTAALALPMMGFGSQAMAGLLTGDKRPFFPKNVIVFMTDQERAIQHFPVGWEQKNLPGMTRLKKHGLTFQNAFTNACMCSPARSTFMSGFFPAQHGVKYTLEQNMPADQYPQVQLPLDLTNVASVAAAAGLNPVYKGKWHCCKAANPDGVAVPQDVGQYGFARWNPPDGGANTSVSEGGGAPTQSTADGNNDYRYMFDNGDVSDGDEGVLDYLIMQAAAQQPFFLVISLVNPHDVLAYPKTYQEFMYDAKWLRGDITLPATVNEDLSSKPTVQQQFHDLTEVGLGALPTPQMQLNYLNFYGNLMKSSDAYLVLVLDTLLSLGLTDDTMIVRTADHGEMALAHGGLRQKNFNFYEEAIRVPLVYSNPRMFPRARSSNALVSHVDFLPTMASLLQAPSSARSSWQGVDYSSLVLNPAALPVQDYIAFTYDDYESGQANGPYPGPLNHIASIREVRYKLAEYYDATKQLPSQWEMYDLQVDPLETMNLAYRTRKPYQEDAYVRLRAKLAEVKATRLQPLT
jgi:arylsulfatase A-like enzyme